MAKENPRNIVEAVESQVTSGCFHVVVIGLVGSILSFVGLANILVRFFSSIQKSPASSAFSLR